MEEFQRLSYEKNERCNRCFQSRRNRCPFTVNRNDKGHPISGTIPKSHGIANRRRNLVLPSAAWPAGYSWTTRRRARGDANRARLSLAPCRLAKAMDYMLKRL